MSTETLSAGTYNLPPDCKAFVRNGKVIVSRKWNTDNTPRCRECRFCVKVRKRNCSWSNSLVCMKQPKQIDLSRSIEIPEHRRFYAARPSDAACSLFEPKTD